MVAARPDATLAEYAAMLAERVGRRFSPAVLCQALRRAGLRRKKKPCTRANRSGPMLRPLGPPGRQRSWVRLIPTGSSSSTERPRYATDPRPCPGATRPARGGPRPRRALAPTDHPWRDRPRWPGRSHDRRRRHQHRHLPRLPGAGADPGAPRPARGLGRHGQPRPRTGPRRCAPRSGEPTSRIATCQPTRPT